MQYLRNMKLGPWTSAEDTLLRASTETSELVYKSWRNVSHVLNRDSKSCRRRYLQVVVGRAVLGPGGTLQNEEENEEEEELGAEGSEEDEVDEDDDDEESDLAQILKLRSSAPLKDVWYELECTHLYDLVLEYGPRWKFIGR
jgi:hypothetical protein